MPLYEYACRGCSTAFEVLVRGDERPVCPQCGGGQLDRLLSVPAVHTSVGRASLPVCGSDSSPPCGPSFCRTGQCDLT